MKKKSGSRIGRVLSRILNVRVWFDWERMKSFTLYLGNGIKRLFIPDNTAVSAQSFAKAQKEYNLTDADLVIQQNALFRLAVIMLIAALLILIYTGYLLFFGTLKAVLVSLAVMTIALVLAFRYHFWYFQIRKRKLGCTIKEWYSQGLLGEKE